ncbi:MAG: hypothetical protein ACPG21_05160 [Crocinitomicaceae bacterium]
MENKPDARELYLRIMHLKQEGKSNWEIEQELLMKGLDQEEAQTMISKTEKALARQEAAPAQAEGGGNGVAGWLIWIGVLILVNILSYAFDWPFWIY